jgi:hypothetical protein
VARLKGPGLSDGRWHHIALTRNNAGQITLYLDGAQCGKPGTSTNSKGPITTNLRTLGCERYHALQAFQPQGIYFNGAVDEFAFFSRELAAAEVKQLAGKR